ncbi:MAG: GGDEF domain-containing protein, partial [Clostridia bacterium]|nr:GGDEF domain-containing protein [Clostridia bacterium]
ALTRAINEYLTDEKKDKGVLFILDIDHFKAINDTYGHDVGDEVISQMGAFLKDYFKNGEIVGRFGGDEFIFFLPDTDDPARACRVAEEVVSGSSGVIRLPEEGKTVTGSLGIALYHGKEKNYSELFKKADLALYDVKSARTFSYKIYEE